MAPGTTFVHDFAGIDRPIEAVLAAVSTALSPESVRELVVRAWTEEVALMTSGTADATDDQVDEAVSEGREALGQLVSQTGPPRVRRDAVVMPVSWCGAEAAGVPPLESDVEFTSFGDDRTHVHLYGRTTISAVADPGSSAASLASRVAVAVVRRFLGELVASIEASIPLDAATSSNGNGNGHAPGSTNGANHEPNGADSVAPGNRSGEPLVS